MHIQNMPFKTPYEYGRPTNFENDDVLHGSSKRNDVVTYDMIYDTVGYNVRNVIMLDAENS